LLETPMYQTATSYGLGAPGVLLWLLPLPMQKTSTAVSMDLRLTDLASGAVVWRDRIHGEASRVTMLYTSQGIIYGPNVLSYSHVFPPEEGRRPPVGLRMAFCRAPRRDGADEGADRGSRALAAAHSRCVPGVRVDEAAAVPAQWIVVHVEGQRVRCRRLWAGGEVVAAHLV